MNRPSSLIFLLAIAILLPLSACSKTDGPDGGSKDGKGVRGADTSTPEGRRYHGAAATLASSDELSLLCPEGPLAFIRLNRMQAIEKEVDKMAVMFGEQPGAASLVEGLGETIMNPEMKGVDLSRPMGLALFVGQMGGPEPVFFLPLSDQKAFQTAIESNEMWEYAKDSVGINYIGKWAVWAPSKEAVANITLRETPVALATKALEGDAAIVVDMVEVWKLIEPNFEEMSSGLSGGGMMPAQLGMIMGGLLDGVKSFLMNSETLSIGATLMDGELALSAKYDARPGSSIGNFLANGKPQEMEYLGMLGSTSFVAAEMHYSPETLWDIFGKIYEMMFAEADPDLIPLIKKAFMMSNGMGIGLGLADGLELVEVISLTDAAGFDELQIELMEKMTGVFEKLNEDMGGGMVPPMSFNLGEPWDHEGTKVTTMVMAFDWEGMGAPPEMVGMMKKFLGEEGLEMHWGVIGDKMVATGGPAAKALFKDIFKRVKDGSPAAMPAAYDRATTGFPAEVNGVCYMNFADLATMVGQMMPEQLNDKQRTLLASPPSDLTCAFYTRSEGPSARFGMRLNLGEMVRYVKAIMESE